MSTKEHIARTQSRSRLPSPVAGLRKWATYDLPRHNRAVLKGDPGAVEALVANTARISGLLTDYVHAAGDALTRSEAREVLQLIGMYASSVEHAYRRRGGDAGDGLARINGLEALLVELGRRGSLPPRDSHTTLWLLNKERRPLTFTGDPQEVYFLRAVQTIDRLHTANCDALRPICRGLVPVTSPDALARLDLAAQRQLEVWAVYRNFTVKDATSQQWPMTPEFFGTIFRTFLVDYPIAGESWTGPNAANVVSQPCADHLMGLETAEYRNNTISARTRHYAREERAQLIKDFQLPSVFDRLVAELGLDAVAFTVCDDETLAAALLRAPESLRRSIDSFGQMCRAAGDASAAHYSLIVNFLMRPAAALSKEQLAALPVPMKAGTGGNSHSDTEAIMYMRKRHPAVSRLLAANSTVKRTDP